MRNAGAAIRRIAVAAACASVAGVVSAQEAADAPPRAYGEALSDTAVNDIEARAAAATAAQQENDVLTQRAKGIAEAVRSPAFDALMGTMSESLGSALGVGDGTDVAPDSTAPPLDRPELATLVFVSSSIPMATLRRYAVDLEAKGGAMILRGGVGGLKEIGPTLRFIADVLRVDPSCEGLDCDMRAVAVLIDPIVFAAAGVGRVPAVAVVEEDPFRSYCERQDADDLKGRWRISYGDASLEGHLDELARRGDARAKRLAEEWRKS